MEILLLLAELEEFGTLGVDILDWKLFGRKILTVLLRLERVPQLNRDERVEVESEILFEFLLSWRLLSLILKVDQNGPFCEAIYELNTRSPWLWVYHPGIRQLDSLCPRFKKGWIPCFPRSTPSQLCPWRPLCSCGTRFWRFGIASYPLRISPVASSRNSGYRPTLSFCTGTLSSSTSLK